jgi:uncharacterized protein
MGAMCALLPRDRGNSRFEAVCGMLTPARGPWPAHSHAARGAETNMKLHSSTSKQYQTVTGYDQSGVEINAARYDFSLTVMPERAPQAWDVRSFEDLSEAHFEAILQLAPDVVILGTGERQRFIHPRLVAALAARRIGVECMDNQAACRTYNILMDEGRKVVLALIIDAPVPAR